MNLFDLALQVKDYSWCKRIYELEKETKIKECTGNHSIIIKIEQIIPFSLLNHAQQYIDEDLISLNKQGLLIDLQDNVEEYPQWAVCILKQIK